MCFFNFDQSFINPDGDIVLFVVGLFVENSFSFVELQDGELGVSIDCNF